jgi:alkylhydroperoxidase family enzyme
MAKSPAALRAYILADAALVRGQLTRRQREQVALAVAEINGSTSSLSDHYAAGSNPGWTQKDMPLARMATAADPKAETLLHFTQAVVLQRGEVSNEDFQALLKAGFTHEQIIEIVANIALNVFASYFNNVAKMGVGDFPPLRPGTDLPRIGIFKSLTQPAALKPRSGEPPPKGRQHRESIRHNGPRLPRGTRLGLVKEVQYKANPGSHLAGRSRQVDSQAQTFPTRMNRLSPPDPLAGRRIDVQDTREQDSK